MELLIWDSEPSTLGPNSCPLLSPYCDPSEASPANHFIYTLLHQTQICLSSNPPSASAPDDANQSRHAS